MIIGVKNNNFSTNQHFYWTKSMLKQNQSTLHVRPDFQGSRTVSHHLEGSSHRETDDILHRTGCFLNVTSYFMFSKLMPFQFKIFPLSLSIDLNDGSRQKQKVFSLFTSTLPPPPPYPLNIGRF